LPDLQPRCSGKDRHDDLRRCFAVWQTPLSCRNALPDVWQRSIQMAKTRSPHTVADGAPYGARCSAIRCQSLPDKLLDETSRRLAMILATQTRHRDEKDHSLDSWRLVMAPAPPPYTPLSSSPAPHTSARVQHRAPSIHRRRVAHLTSNASHRCARSQAAGQGDGTKRTNRRNLSCLTMEDLPCL
jgi:hypothetical protein